MWSNSIDVYADRVDKKETKIPKYISDDYYEFIRMQAYLQEILKKFYVRIV